MTDYEKHALGQDPDSVVWRSLDIGPFSGEEIPTLGMMDAEFDPVWVQFGDSGVAYVVPFGSWCTFSDDDFNLIRQSYGKARKMWEGKNWQSGI